MLDEINVFAPIGTEEVETDLKPAFTLEQLFDQYYDYISLHKTFGDDKYMTTVNEILVQVETKQYIDEKEVN